ncbi:Fur family transcriptional regulator, zinc uptake regulator [Kaistia soli DSM 19436]|uniref:Fur family transcriptional regulator, zinc uptake regulator n=1 Tax=Kaistia soli DSM 19436 TaxID=1122133 RepID=A0A1M5ITA9_9HYPH|nr:transcriptional repressor [Kaistia soli]SHG31259.1 Fur family transcriptional regulator, zinc uptake regulator [Kaistia soli DSM 19436]
MNEATTGETAGTATPHEHGEHDHGHCERDAIAHAEAVSAASGLRFTDQRRKVLAALAESHVPASAYDVIDRLAREGPRPAPVSVYRALDFLVENGFAHRIESRNAYIACTRSQRVGTSDSSHGHGAATVFLLCEACGAAAEASSEALTVALDALTEAASFAPRAPVIEIRGLCARCRANA